jgi:CBS domain-containing protein
MDHNQTVRGPGSFQEVPKMSLSGEIGSCSVAEVMGTEMFTVTPETAVSSARRLVLETDVHHMLVLDQGTLAGIVGLDDLRLADRDARIGDCMTSPVLCITPDTTLQEAVDIMGANDIDCLPVVTGTFLIGIVTLEALATANLSPGGEPMDAQGSGTAQSTCAACASTHDVGSSAPPPARDLSLCVRCRGVLHSNQRC